MIARSSGVSGPGFSRIASGIATLPTSCSGAAWLRRSQKSASMPICSASSVEKPTDPLDVSAGVLVAELDRHRQPANRLGLRDLELGERAVQLVASARRSPARAPSAGFRRTRQPSSAAAIATIAKQPNSSTELEVRIAPTRATTPSTAQAHHNSTRRSCGASSGGLCPDGRPPPAGLAALRSTLASLPLADADERSPLP